MTWFKCLLAHKNGVRGAVLNVGNRGYIGSTSDYAIVARIVRATPRIPTFCIVHSIRIRSVRLQNGFRHGDVPGVRGTARWTDVDRDWYAMGTVVGSGPKQVLLLHPGQYGKRPGARLI